MFSKILGLALGAALLVSPAIGFAQSAMNSAADCTADGLHSAMSKMSSEWSSMKSTGDVDKDYAHAMMGLSKGQRDLSAWEMKCGKDSKTMKMAKDSMHSSTTQYNAWSTVLSAGS